METKIKIYGLYDHENHLRYIGLTSKSLKARLDIHLLSIKTNSKKNCHRICWLKSLVYKGNLPTIKLIEETNSLEEAQCREKYWIKYFRRKKINLVNTTIGGEGTNGYKWTEDYYLKRSKGVKQYNIDGDLIEVFSSMSEAAERVTGNRENNSKISQGCKGLKGRKIVFGYIWRYIEDSFNTYSTTREWNVTEEQKKAISKRQTENNVMKNKIGKLNSKSCPVQQIDDNGNIIGEFDSITIAREKTGVTSISYAAMWGTKRGNYFWRYVDKDIVQSS